MDVKMKLAVVGKRGGASGGPISKTSVLNQMLLRAWRERWTDAQFGINIKTDLPRGVSGDAYNLADCILKQALVGSDANRLVLSYLRHSLCSHLISHAAVFKRISKYERFENTYSIIALLEFLEAMLGGITCRSKPEESQLGNAVLSLVYWLAQAYLKVLEHKSKSITLSAEHTEMAERAFRVLDLIVGHQYMRAIIVVASHEDPVLFAELRTAYLKIKNDTLNTGFTLDVHSTTTASAFDELLKTIAKSSADQMPVMSASDNTHYEAVSYCLQPFLTVKVLQNPNTETKSFVADLQMIQHMKNYTQSRLYFEIFRACLISLFISSTERESIWCAFTFIKVPHVIRELSFSRQRVALGLADPKLGYCPDVVQAFELLTEEPILDFVDTKCACNTAEYMLTELAKQGLVTGDHIQRIAGERREMNDALAKIDQINPTSIIRFVICAETPFSGILQALSADYSKMQEPLLGMFVQVLSGNSLELILSVAAVEGKLRTFVARLINCNEQSLYVEAADKDKSTTVKASLFDVSFLMLTCIVQTYGSAVVLEGGKKGGGGASFFERWVRECMVERHRHKSAMQMIQRRGGGGGADQQQLKIDELLMHLNNGSGGGGGNRPSSGQIDGSVGSSASPPLNGGGGAVLPWQDVCQTLPALLHHVLLAWENETMSAADVQTVLDAIKSRMCAFSVCAASWLNAYMLVVREGELQKPQQMLQQLLLHVQQPDDTTQKDNFHERHLLASQIVRKMQHDAHPSQQAAANNSAMALMVDAATGSRPASLITQNLLTVDPLEQQFEEMWKTTMQRGWLPIDSIQTLDALLETCGPFWLVSRLLDEIMRCKFAKEMLRIMDVVFALMHMHIGRCTVALLSEWLPMLLLNRLQNTELLAPHAAVLARLCVMCILATLDPVVAADAASSGGGALKRRHSPLSSAAAADASDDHRAHPSPSGQLDLDLDAVGPMLKVRKIELGDSSTNGSASAAACGGDFVFDMASANAGSSSSTIGQGGRSSGMQESLVQLFKQFGHFVSVDQLTPKIYFISQFLTLLVQLGGARVKSVLRLAPAHLMQNLLRVTVCDEYTTAFILRVYDLDTASGRRQAMADLSLLRNIQLGNESVDL